MISPECLPFTLKDTGHSLPIVDYSDVRTYIVWMPSGVNFEREWCDWD